MNLLEGDGAGTAPVRDRQHETEHCGPCRRASIAASYSTAYSLGPNNPSKPMMMR